jgi:hypothetical protein
MPAFAGMTILHRSGTAQGMEVVEGSWQTSKFLFRAFLDAPQAVSDCCIKVRCHVSSSRDEKQYQYGKRWKVASDQKGSVAFVYHCG